MKPEQINIAIATWCGWSQIRNANTMACGGIWVGYPPSGAIIGKPESLPDYLSDLNAIHCAEMKLTEEQKDTFRLELARLTNQGLWLCGYHISNLIHATAPQRCDALLKTIGELKQ